MNLHVKVHPVIATVVFAAAVIAIVVKAWGDGRALAVGGPAQLLRAPSGDIYIQVQNTLLQHSADGVFKRRIDLAELGVNRLIGGIALFPNGDILVRRGDDPRSLYDKLRAYARLASTRTILSKRPGEGLARCNLERMQCTPFATPAIDFKATFHAVVDARGTSVYVSDTSRHTLRKYSSAGHELSSVARGVRFPNQLLLHDGQLLVADTNNHRIATFDVSRTELPETASSFDVIPDEAGSRGERWPTHFAHVAGHWWVNNMRRDMRNGGVYVFDADWQFVERLQLPDGADPIAILPLATGALISDWDNDRIYRLDEAGRMLGDFTSSGLRTVLQESAERRNFYRVVSWLGIALFVLMLAALLLKGLTEPAEEKRRRCSRPAHRAVEPPGDWVWFRPDPPRVRTILWSARIALSMALLLIAALLLLVAIRQSWQILVALALPLAGLAGFMAVLYAMSAAIAGTAVGLRGNQIALRDHRGRESRSSMNHVVFSDAAIATRDRAVLLGHPRKSIYNRQQIDEQLMPHLGKATRIPEWRMQVRIIRLSRPGTLLLAVVVVASTAVGAALLLASCA
jgi:hypothetical protein